MTGSDNKLADVASEWRSARRVYAVYSAILKSTDLEIKPCKALQSPVDRADEKSLAEVRAWLAEMDGKTTAAHIRQILQSSSLGNEPCLRSLIQRYLARPERSDEDRNKLDFLLVQYLAETAPRSLALGRVSLEDVAKVLEPVIGESSLELPRQLEPLKALIDHVEACRSLNDLISQRMVESGRKLKAEAGKMYFAPAVMVAFARYNFLLRRAFVRLLHEDLEVIKNGLRELEKRGAKAVDCSAAGFTASEPIGDLRGYCRSWRNVFVADYKSGPSFESIPGVRKVIDSALRAQRHHATAKLELAPKPEVEQNQTEAASVAGRRSVSSEIAAIEDARARVNAAVKHAAAEKEVTLQQRIESIKADIRKQVMAKAADKPTTITVTVGPSMMVLSGWELKAFTDGKAEDSAVLERAVVARVLLNEAVEKKSKIALSEARAVLELALTVASELQENIAKARSGRKLESAVNMAASAKRLSTLKDEAEKCLSVSK